MRSIKIHRWWAGAAICTTLLASCGEDRTGEYYAMIDGQRWIYETMQQNYLFYEDLPEESNINFFQQPEAFLSAVASSRDKKNGILFSHVDSVVATRAASYPSFGLEGVMVRNDSLGDYAMHVLYTEPSSPAAEAGLKRGDWIIAVDDKKLSAADYSTYFAYPTQSYRFTLGALNQYNVYDTLQTVTMPIPRLVEQQDLYLYKTLEANGKKVGYVLYNIFGDADQTTLTNAFAEIAAASPTDLILDLRYNPGGSVYMAQVLSTLLVPQSAIGQPFLHMTFNDKINRTDTYNFEASLQPNGAIPYEHLYIITSDNTASASEIVINCLKPYLGDKLIQVGATTFGKNVAQSLFTNKNHPQLELWLTTAYLSNAAGNQDYSDGLKPDYEVSENYAGTLLPLGEWSDTLLSPIYTHLTTGSFPATATQTAIRSTHSQLHTVYNSIGRKPRLAKIKQH